MFLKNKFPWEILWCQEFVGKDVDVNEHERLSNITQIDINGTVLVLLLYISQSQCVSCLYTQYW